METVLGVAGNIANVVGTLQPALACLNAIYLELSKVSNNREKCKTVCARARDIVVMIDNDLKGRSRPAAEVERSVARLMENLEFLRETMIKVRKIDFFRSLLREGTISKQIEEANVRLSDTLACFNLSTGVKISDQQAKYEDARRRDAEDLRKRINELASNDAKLIQELGVKQNQMVDAMLALQKQLASHPAGSVENHVLLQSLNALQRQSNKAAPQTTPDWTITAYDIDIESDCDLGQGTFGMVLKAMWNQTPVAVKQMLEGASEQVLLHEIEVYRKLRHPHILPFYGASINSHPAFFVCQFMENGNLLGYLRKNSLANRVQLVHEVALGMAYLHTMGVIHGDLKANNVLINDGGRACLADFGLSRVKQDALAKTRAAPIGTGLGTLRFMAPEAMRGQITFAADIYSFGMLIYEIMTEETPFSTVPDVALYASLAGDHPQRLSRPTSKEASARGLTNGLWALVLDCTSPSPTHRPNANIVASRTKDLCIEWARHLALHPRADSVSSYNSNFTPSTTSTFVVSDDGGDSPGAKPGSKRSKIKGGFAKFFGRKSHAVSTPTPALSPNAPIRRDSESGVETPARPTTPSHIGYAEPLLDTTAQPITPIQSTKAEVRTEQVAEDSFSSTPAVEPSLDQVGAVQGKNELSSPASNSGSVHRAQNVHETTHKETRDEPETSNQSPLTPSDFSQSGPVQSGRTPDTPVLHTRTDQPPSAGGAGVDSRPSPGHPVTNLISNYTDSDIRVVSTRPTKENLNSKPDADTGNRKNGPPRKCILCLTKPRGDDHFCSERCRSQARKKIEDPWKKSQSMMMIKFCRKRGCGLPIYGDPPADPETGYRTSDFCSLEHAEDAIRSGQIDACLECLKWPKGDDSFCSIKCRKEALSL